MRRGNPLLLRHRKPKVPANSGGTTVKVIYDVLDAEVRCQRALVVIQISASDSVSVQKSTIQSEHPGITCGSQKAT